MLKFEQQAPKEWKIVYGDGDEDAFSLRLGASSVTNKFHLVTDYITRVAEFHGQPFSDWLIDLLEQCTDPQKRAGAVTGNVENIKKYSDAYLDSVDYDYSKFVDVTKAKKNSILFQADEIERIIRLSCYLKIYSLISNSEKLGLGEKLHRTVYNRFSANVIDTEVASKIFDVVKTKTFRYNLTDKFMWDYIRTIQCKDIGIHIIEIFNFIMNNIIILCEETKNPITYFVSITFLF